jgi:DNA-binding NarL/FixJ family response regulator
MVVAEDSFLVREGIAKLLDGCEDVEVIAFREDLPGLLEAVEQSPPDVVLTDIRMPPTSTDEGIRAAATLRAQHPEVGVVVLSQYAEPAYVLALLEGGSEGRAYLLKERLSDAAQLIGAVREVARGGSVVDPKVVEVLVAARSRGPARATDAPGVRSARGDRPRQEQRNGRHGARAVGARSRETHQLDVLEAGAVRGA